MTHLMYAMLAVLPIAFSLKGVNFEKVFYIKCLFTVIFYLRSLRAV